MSRLIKGDNRIKPTEVTSAKQAPYLVDKNVLSYDQIVKGLQFQLPKLKTVDMEPVNVSHSALMKRRAWEKEHIDEMMNLNQLKDALSAKNNLNQHWKGLLEPFQLPPIKANKRTDK